MLVLLIMQGILFFSSCILGPDLIPTTSKKCHQLHDRGCRFNDYGTDGGLAAKSLEPKLHVFSKHVSAHTGFEIPEFEIKAAVAAAIAMKGVGGLLFIFGSALGAFLLLLHQAIFIPVLYDFYNYDPSMKEFNQLFIKFTQSLALFGALLFFIGMRNSIPRRQLKKKPHKKQI